MTEYLDIVDEAGLPTGETVSRDIAHRDGILHRTAHVWVARKQDGQVQILLQKRSMDKESFPGMYDTSSAGHIPAGSEPLESALRELREELGIAARPEQLHYMGRFHVRYEKVFHGRLFRDNEITQVYLYREPVEIEALKLQETELDEVRWFPLNEVREEIRRTRERFCVPSAGLKLLQEYLDANEGIFQNDKEDASMEFKEVVKNRYSCKKYSDRKVEPEKLEAILNAGRLAPTAKNLQEQHVYVLQSAEALAKVDAVTPCRYGASTVLAVAFDSKNVYTYPGGKRDSGIEDAAIVATHMILAAADEGVDSCWINRFDPELLAQALGLPEGEELLMLMDLGYAAEGAGPLPNHNSRKPLAETVSYL